MNSNTQRLIGVLLTATLTTLGAGAAPVPKPNPAPSSGLSGNELTFLKLRGVDPKTGIFSRSAPVTKTVYRPEVRQRTVTRLVQGKQVQEVVPYTVMVPVTEETLQILGTKTHDVYDGSGKLISADIAFSRLANGQIGLLCSTSSLPEGYLRMLSANAIILVPKRKASPKK